MYKILQLEQEEKKMANDTAKKVAVIMGSDSDLPTVKPAIDKLKSFGVEVEAHVMQRTPHPCTGK